MEYSEIRELFQPLCQSMESDLDGRKEVRDEFNAKVRTYLDSRNEVNRQVKELISEVRSQKEVRDLANSKVKELKITRSERSDELKVVRTALRSMLAEAEENGKREKGPSGPPPSKIKAKMDAMEKKYERGGFTGASEKKFFREMKRLKQEWNEARERNKTSGGLGDLKSKVREAERSQEDAHNKVERAVSEAQEAYDLMVELSDEVDRLRERANSAHSGLTKSKKEADALHNLYIVSLRCIHSMQDLLKAIDAREGDQEDGGGKTEVTDLMSRLMSGDTLSTDELMALQRN